MQQNPQPPNRPKSGFCVRYGRIWRYGQIQRKENVPMDISRFIFLENLVICWVFIEKYTFCHINGPPKQYIS